MQESTSKKIIVSVVITVLGGVLTTVILKLVLPADSSGTRGTPSTETVSTQISTTAISLDEIAKRNQLEKEHLQILRERVALEKDQFRARNVATGASSGPGVPSTPASADSPPSVGRNLTGQYFDQTGAQYSVLHQVDQVAIVQMMAGMPVYTLQGQLAGNQALLHSPQNDMLSQIFGTTTFTLEVPPDPNRILVHIPGVATYRLTRM